MSLHPALPEGPDRVRFTYDPDLWGVPAARSVALAGSFTDWAPAWNLAPDGPVWTLVLDRATVDFPGNSGEPEFRFVVDGQTWVACPDIGGWPRIGTNALVPLSGRTQDEREANHRAALVLKTRADEYPDDRAMANFRMVCGGMLAPGRLFRSYHPFLASRDTPVEALRLAASARLMAEAGVGAVINLTDGPEIAAFPGLPPFYAALAARGDVLFVETSYEDAYRNPGGESFVATLTRVVQFVAGRPGPFLVHCRLGMDRTGVVTAFLAALAGLPWAEVVADYLKSNALGIQEYRDESLLARSFSLMLGADPRSVADLSGGLVRFAIGRGLDPEVLRRAVSRLRTPVSGVPQ